MEQRDLAEDLISLKEHNDFWQKSRDEVLKKLISEGPVLDVGCGAGVMTEALMKKGLEVYSTDIDQRLVDYTKRLNRKTFLSDITALSEEGIKKLGLPKFKAALAADTIEHIEKDATALRNINKLLELSGKLVISVPYHKFFWTESDVARGHWRRYSRKELMQKLEGTGFRVERIMFRSFLPILPFLIFKLIRHRFDHEKISKSWLNSVLLWYFKNIENRLNMPIGTELICVARKTEEAKS